MADAAKVITMDWALGVCRAPDARRLNRDTVAAGADSGLLVVADGIEGYGTGWLAARLAVRMLFERLGKRDASTRYIGAANEYPSDWGWPGADRSREAIQRLYDQCAADFGEPSALPGDLAGLFATIGRVVENCHAHERMLQGLVVGCTAAVVAGTHVRGAHSGVGRALVLRAGAERFASLTVEQYLHLIYERLSTDPSQISPDQIPHNVLCGYLSANRERDWIDRFEVDLQVGDVLLLCSRRLNVDDDIVAGLIRAALRDGTPLAALARTIERRSAETVTAEDRKRDVAFVLALAGPGTAPTRFR